jgi:hypothetical protein
MEKSVAALASMTFLGLMAIGSIAAAYEFSTHAAVTREAYLRSDLYPLSSATITRLGLGDRQIDLGDVYIDVGPNGTWSRLAFPKDNPTFGRDKINDANRVTPSGVAPPLRSLAGWLMLGSIREDDVPWDARSSDNTPQDDPNGVMARVLRHFFDPKYDAPLVVVGLINLRTPDWALGLPSTPLDNHFNLPAAREAMWRAATLTTVDSAANIIPIGVPADFPYYQTPERQQEALRVAYWATTFHALGSTVHLLQDMAQPQHTRNDPHSGMGCSVLNVCAYGHASYYEQYIEARATGQRLFTLKERLFPWSPLDETTVPTNAPTLDYGQYTPVKLNSKRDYFASGVRAESESGVGLANYSNQGFYSAGSNIGSLKAGSYASPPPNGDDPRLRDATLTNLTNSQGQPVAGSLTLKKGAVADHNYPSSTDGADVALSSFGIFDQFLAPSGGRSFTLNHYNYDDQARLLIPRAVGYSAGFLNHFFRGKLDLKVPAEGAYGVTDQSCLSACGFSRLKVNLKNATPSEDLNGGVLVAVVLYHTYSGYETDLAEQPGSPSFVGFGGRSLSELMTVSSKVDVSGLAGGKLASGAAQDVTFTFPTPIPLNATDITLQIAFRGTLGNESDAVIVSSKDISEPTFFGFANNTDYVWDLAGQRYRPLPFGGYTNPDDVLDLKVRFSNTAATPAATLPKLAVRQHAQLAALTDLGQQTAYYDYHTSSTTQTYPTVPVQYDSTQFFSPWNTNGYDANVKVNLRRGVYRQNYAAFNFPRDDVLICLVQNEHCIQSTLPALAPADRVAWSINF